MTRVLQSQPQILGPFPFILLPQAHENTKQLTLTLTDLHAVIM